MATVVSGVVAPMGRGLAMTTKIKVDQNRGAVEARAGRAGRGTESTGDVM